MIFSANYFFQTNSLEDSETSKDVIILKFLENCIYEEENYGVSSKTKPINLELKYFRINKILPDLR